MPDLAYRAAYRATLADPASLSALDALDAVVARMGLCCGCHAADAPYGTAGKRYCADCVPTCEHCEETSGHVYCGDDWCGSCIDSLRLADSHYCHDDDDEGASFRALLGGEDRVVKCEHCA